MAQTKKKKNTKKAKTNGAEVVKPVEYEYFLLLEAKTDVNDVIAKLKEKQLPGLDVWETMGVFNIEPKQNHATDFEELSVEETFTDPKDHSFIRNRNIQSAFSFVANDEQLGLLKPYLKDMVEIFGGFCCSDSEDFQPMVELD